MSKNTASRTAVGNPTTQTKTGAYQGARFHFGITQSSLTNLTDTRHLPIPDHLVMRRLNHR